jgi:hypothetical protein
MTKKIWSPFGFLAFLACGTLLGQQADIPLNNWTVPPYTQESSGITTMADVTPPRAFIGIQPCRVADTRGNGAPIQGGIFPDSGLRTWDVTGICGIPAGTDAISVNFSVVSAAATPLGGFLLAWPIGQAPPPTAIMTYGPGTTIISNAAIVPLGPSEQLRVNVSHSTHIIMDVNGYFSDAIGTSSNALLLINDNPGSYTAAFGNLAGTNGSSGVLGTAGLGFARPDFLNAGVRGESQATGVRGVSRLQGVAGSVVSSGGSELAFGVLGFDVNLLDPAINGQDVGVFGYTGSAAAQAGAIIGYAPVGSGAVAGVRGVIGSQSFGAAGVRGQDGGGAVPLNWPTNYASAGVRGESNAGTGVIGFTHAGNGATGVRVNANGDILTGGILGDFGSLGLTVFGDSFVTGSKSFIEPHPTDASKLIRYISLEGNESGTYFRGRGKFQNGIAVIEVPEDFRVVTDPEGLSIQVTPIGQMATVAVESIGLDRIVVRGSRNVEFFYLVNGVRQAYKGYGPIAENERVFVPRSPDESMPLYLPERLQRRLISNGTYTAEGKVNLETARRLGWDKIWEQRARPTPQPTEP